MRLELTGRHLEITPALRRLVVSKLAKLERVLNDSAVSAQAVLTRERHLHRADITLHARGEKFLHGFGASGSWETSVNEAIDKLSQQAVRVKGKWREGRRRAGKGTPMVGEEREAAVVRPVGGARVPRVRPRMPRILRAERRAIKAMSVAEAAREVDVNGDGVVVFRDAETSAISVLYRRHNGEIALIETEA